MPYLTHLRRDLLGARKVRDTEMVSLIRTLISAIENAQAVDSSESNGASEVPRRHLSDDDILSIVRSEGEELRDAAGDYETRGNRREAERLRSLALVADRYAEAFAGKT